MPVKKSLLGLMLLLIMLSSTAQNYNAIHGSRFAGSLGVVNNPAAMVNTPYKWDLTLFALQAKASTNGLQLNNFSLLSPKNTELEVKNGDFSRYAHFATDLHLLNARYSLNRRQAFGFGINIRSNAHVTSGRFNYQDTITTGAGFLTANRNTNPAFNASIISSSWAEYYGSYSQTVWESDNAHINAGITLKISRGISGAFARVRNLTYRADQPGANADYFITGGRAEYGYSINYDGTYNNASAMKNVKDFMRQSRSFIGADIGIEYIFSKDNNRDEGFYSINNDPMDHDLKIGVSVLDIGKNNYTYGVESRKLAGAFDKDDNFLSVRNFPEVSTFDQFNDSVQANIISYGTPTGVFAIQLPTRLVINVDKNLGYHFYLNGELSFNFYSASGDRGYNTRELNLLTITPRWETVNWGAYLPVQYNTQGQVWVGGALRLGPFLLGLHDLTWLRKSNKAPNGGFYLAAILRRKYSTEKKSDCPSF
jgi:hypothetical protein